MNLAEVKTYKEENRIKIRKKRWMEMISDLHDNKLKLVWLRYDDNL